MGIVPADILAELEPSRLRSGPGRADASGSWSPGFATAEWVEIAAGLVEQLEPFADRSLNAWRSLGGLHGATGDGVKRRHRVAVGPGRIRVASSVTGAEDRSLSGSVRGVIVEWSKDSRLNMVEAMCSVDWGPVVAPSRPGWRPGMVTLTLPRDWRAVAPSAAAFKKVMERFWSRWARKWGPVRCVWKLEFQRRGAPHVHIYVAVPPGREFQEWLSMTWTAAVFGLPRFGPRRSERTWAEFCDRVYRLDGKAIGDHLRAGTGIDWREGITASDPKRLAVYFLKRAAGHNLGADKEYQHRVPPEWQATGGAGRFWGIKGLSKASVEVQVTGDDFVALRRTLRRWAKANGRPVRSLAGGVGQGGMVLANDAPNLLSQAARSLRPPQRSKAEKEFSGNGDAPGGGAEGIEGAERGEATRRGGGRNAVVLPGG